MTKQFNIVVCGSARVGKSTLVNAICGRELAKTSNSLSSKTDQIEKYILNRVYMPTDHPSNSIDYSITIWDTPGIESWTEDHVKKYFTKIMLETAPLCMIYCASPGSFARLDQLQWLIDTSIQSNIFCALVSTNKYSGGSQQRKQLLNDFDSLLSRYHSMTRNENNIALCTSVNSIKYEDEELGIRKDVEGINELIFGITTSLKDEKRAAWCFTIADNLSFWSTMFNQISDLFEIARPTLENFVREHGNDIAKNLLPIILTAIMSKK
jgi:GTPase SAR1 family protein